MPVDRKAMDSDATLARRRPTGSSGLCGRCDRSALMRAIRQEGSEIMTEAGRSWWKDQERMYPWLNTSKHREQDWNLAGTKSRYGNVTKRFTVERGWEKYEHGRWIPMPPPPSRMFPKG